MTDSHHISPEPARRRARVLAPTALLALTLATAAPALEVTAPGPAGVTVAEGVDYATVVLGDRWDFDDDGRLPLHLNNQVQDFAVEDGLLGGRSTGEDPWFYLLDPGVVSAVEIDDGDRFPIDPRRFSRLALKFRHDSPEAARFTVFWNDECRCFAPAAAFGRTPVLRIPAGGWQVLSIDLPANIQDETPWEAYDDLQSLRIDPFRRAGFRFDLDWVRLVPAAGVSPAALEVRWTHAAPDPASFTILAVDGDGAALVLADDIPGSRRGEAVDVAPLAPGPWTIRVRASDGSVDDAPGTLRIDAAPVPTFEVPHRRGDVARSYAARVLANPWGPLDQGDVRKLENLANASYAGGALTAVSTNDDPGVVFFTTSPIDASLYTQLSFVMKLSDPVLLQNGQGVARVIYGPTRFAADADPTEDIVLRPGTVEYILGDLRTIPLEGLRPSAWRGGIDFLRLDPHESPLAKTVTVPALRLAPEFSADPTRTLVWSVDDPDSAQVETCLFLDPDEVPGSGNEQALEPCVTGPPGRQQLTIDFTGVAPAGFYHLYGISDDGRNRVTRYAGGRLHLGPAVGTPRSVIFSDGFERTAAAR